MALKDLSIIERKTLGAMMILANKDKVVSANTEGISKTMGYKRSGGAITLALRLLEANGCIKKIDKAKYKVLI